MLWPSGALFATTPAPMVPLAPPRFSTTNGLPSCSESSLAVRRPMTSVVPPGGKPTMTRTEGPVIPWTTGALITDGNRYFAYGNG